MENTFGKNIIPQNEEERLENLKKYKILYTQSDPILDQLAAGAATSFGAPLAMINFVDKDNVWMKANNDDDIDGGAERGSSLCSLAILKDRVTVFEDFLTDPLLLSNPLFAGEHGFRFYAAAPIKTSEGFNIGVVCILDTKPRKFTDGEQKQLECIAETVRIEIEKRI
ncbi:GAF domain-containing protein [Pedobacter sp. AW31-3R]|uniref:GAF domain-containing protein n=1 Tax=Pedobacter sp. AW31-3R TaxID=3445781 RepID=UPI003FA18E86